MPTNLVAAIIAIVVAISLPNALRADPTDNSGNELLKTPARTDPSAPHKITYKLSDGSEKWDADARARIVKAMDEAVAIYNKNGDFQRVLTANWSPGTPTADANFGGWINFGGQISTRTALHEIAHTLGIGTSPNWSKYSVDGKWTGQYGIAQLKELDGPDAVLHCDRQHFWPYGLNYDSEVKTDSFKRNVLMVTAMRADMGLGPPPHPATAALKAAFADATDAHAEVDKAQAEVNQLQAKLRAGLSARPEVVQATKATASAKAAYDSAVANELKVLQQNQTFLTLQSAANSSRRKLDELQADPAANADDREAAAQAMLAAKSALSQFENKDLAACSQVAAAKSVYHDAILALGAAQKAPLLSDPELLDARKSLSAAVAKSKAADQAVTTAEQAALKEQTAPLNGAK
jgi:hypothetical protein